MKTVTSPPQIAPKEFSLASCKGYVFKTECPLEMAWTASEITSDSNFPPPIVPTLRPSSYTTIFAPGSRGAEPVTFAIVAKAHASPFFKASSNR